MLLPIIFVIVVKAVGTAITADQAIAIGTGIRAITAAGVNFLKDVFKDDVVPDEPHNEELEELFELLKERHHGMKKKV